MIARVVTLLAASGIVFGDVSISLADPADKQRELILKQKDLRARDRAFEDVPTPPPPPPPQQTRGAPQQPNSVLGDGLLGNSAAFTQGGPSATGRLPAPSGGRGGSGPVIK